MISVDLRRFKRINAQWGQAAGDAVLVQAAARLRAVVSSSDWIARVGADEFAILILSGPLETRAMDVARAALAALRVPYATDWGVALLDAAAGVVVAPRDGDTAEALRDHVDLALHRAKVGDNGAPCVFDLSMDAEARDHRRPESDLSAAVDASRIELAYQPLISAATGRITSAEALARWTHPTHGPIRPDVFITLAESAGLIDALGAQILAKACDTAQSWPAEIRVAVNLSPLQLTSGRLVETVRGALDRSASESTGCSSRSPRGWSSKTSSAPSVSSTRCARWASRS